MFFSKYNWKPLKVLSMSVVTQYMILKDYSGYFVEIFGKNLEIVENLNREKVGKLSQLGCVTVAQAKDEGLDQALGSGDGGKQKNAVDISESGQARPNDGLAMWEEGGVKHDSQISGVSVWVDEVANSEMETLEEEQILTRGGEWNEDLNFSHVKCEMPVKTSSKQSWS